MDWHTDVMKKRKAASYQKLNYYLDHIDEFPIERYREKNSGAFCNKFATISGMFAIVEYYEGMGGLENLLSVGPNFVVKYMVKQNIEIKVTNF